MKIFDMHIHSQVNDIRPEEMVARMNSVGISGGTVFSPKPESPLNEGNPYETRMECLEKWTSACPDSLIPILYIHPLEKDAIAKAKDAVSRGVMGFKITCDCFYVYEEKSMALLREIAKMGKPVMFHSGILWGGQVSSKYNRPLNWEALLEIDGLRFSLAHCAWPWYDETIALYGKFLNAYASNPTVSAEMFLDLTPGTPKIYRYDLINKLYNCAYDTPHNMMFGTDCTINDYNSPWAKLWVDFDTEIMDKIGVGKHLQQLYFADNFMRFIGKKEKDFNHITPVPDKADGFSLEYANNNFK